MYEKIFNHLIAIGYSQLNTSFSPQALTCHFELEAINAATKIFPNIDITACFFHYSIFLEIVTRSKTSFIGFKIKNKKKLLLVRRTKKSYIDPILSGNIIDEFTSETPPIQDFSNYKVETYVCQQSSRYTVEL